MDDQPLYDRRVPDPLLCQLSPGGAFDWVTALARLPVARGLPATDLGLRASPGKKPGEAHATLYVGSTQVLGVHWRGKEDKFFLTPHAKDKLFADLDPPFEAAWSEHATADHFASLRENLIRHVWAALGAAPAGRQKEGFLQAAVSKSANARFTAVDREIMTAFLDTPTRERWKDAWRTELTAGVQKSLGAQVKPPGNKLDNLAVSSTGQLLVIEVKPGSESKSLGATPLQVAMYRRMLNAWRDADPEAAQTVLNGMIEQRATLGLGLPLKTPLRAALPVVPVIAVGLPVKHRAAVQKEFEAVRHALEEVGEPLEGLQVWGIDKLGNIVIDDASTLDERFG